MARQDVTLHDRYDLAKSPVLVSGTQALVRLMLMQRARDEAAGLDTAGYVTGYRGSPLGAVDMQMQWAQKELEAARILFQPGLNEDLAATALWGTQQAELRGEGRHAGVFGLWYGKGPGVDRSGDAIRHANLAGTSPLGGVLMVLGDDHTGESSTTLHQSDLAMFDAGVPLVSPAGVQEILDFGLYGWALSRFAGLWVGLKAMKDTVEATAVVDGRPDRMTLRAPEFDMPEGGLNIRLVDTPYAQEARLIDHKHRAAEAFARSNRIDRRVWGRAGARIGFVAAGKSWLDLAHAMDLLGIDEAGAEDLGITTYKVGQTFPLDMLSLREWAEGLELIVIVEEKRKLIELQVKDGLFDGRGRRIWGRRRGDGGDELFPARFALDPVSIAEKVGGIVVEMGRGTERLQAALQSLVEARGADNAEDIAARLPYFCSGCPHNTSTRVPEGSHAYAGIGCHFMAQFMERDTQGYTHMGGEGANWIGEAPFSTRGHVFQNIGDGTYNHSGVQAIRAAIAAGVSITYKILYNDAVAMTGGQGNDGDLTPGRIAHELRAMGVLEIAVVFDEKEEPERRDFPNDVGWHPRDELDAVQRRMREVPGVSAIVYVQTCAAEKRRRRRTGRHPDPDVRVFIDTEVCEGCGDCGVQSNCVSIVPVETELGRKRSIDQSSCNKDLSCLAGFCPSFATVEGARPQRRATVEVDIGELPEPSLPTIRGTHNIVVTGIGGTGVVTIGAIVTMAAHLDGRGAAMMEMAGLAQKGGAVHIHCRIAHRPEDITAIRVAAGECDALIGGDLVVSAAAQTLGLLQSGRASGVVNSHETMTGAFTRDTEFRIPVERLTLSLERRLRDRLTLFDASGLARLTMGDAIYSNMIVLGAAWQRGLVPVTREAALRAIELNGTAVEPNVRAFALGRWAALHPAEVARLLAPAAPERPKTLEERIAFRAEHLHAYQSRRLSRRYRALVDGVGDERLRAAVALGYHKLLAYKDEYEVARLLAGTRLRAETEFGADVRLTHHLAPPILSRRARDGRPAKRRFGPWIGRLFPILARGRVFRGTLVDPFGWTAERRMERALIRQYEADMAEILPHVDDATHETAVALAELPLQIRGFGPVKAENARRAALTRETLLAAFRAGGRQVRHAAE